MVRFLLKPNDLVSAVRKKTKVAFGYPVLRQLRNFSLIVPVEVSSDRGHADLYELSAVDRIISLLEIRRRTRLTLSQLVHLKEDPGQFIRDIKAISKAFQE